MKRLLPFFFVLIPLSTFASEAVTFQFKPIDKAQTVTIQSGQMLNLGMQVTSGEAVIGDVLQNTSSTEDITFKVEKWSPKKRQATLTYGDNGEIAVQEVQGEKQTEEKKAPVANKSYTVTWKKGANEDSLKIKSSTGKVSDAENKIVQQDWYNLAIDTPKDMHELIAGKTLNIGDQVPTDTDTIISAFDLKGANLSLADVSITLTKMEEVAGEEMGVFNVQFTLSGRDGNEQQQTDMNMTLAGVVFVPVNGTFVQQFSLSGPINISGTNEQAGQILVMKGSGQAQMRFDVKQTPN